MRNVTTIDMPATDLAVGQVLAEVLGEPLHRGRIRQWVCRRRNRQLINGYPVATMVDYLADGEGGRPTVYVQSSEKPGWTWCLRPGEVVKVVA